MDRVVIFGLTVGDLAGRSVMLAVAVLVAALASRALARLLDKLLDVSRVPSASIFVNISRALVWALALLSVVQPVFGIQPTAFVTALGVTSLAISLGMQDTISNVVGGLGLMVGRVLQPGDAIEVNGFSGEVVDLTWRATVVRDRLGNEQVIPNSVLTKTALKRLSAGSASLVEVDVVVRHGADLDAVARELSQAAEEALRGKLVEGQKTGVCFLGSDAFGVSCAVYLHVKDDVTSAQAADALMRSVAAAPWLARGQ